MWRLRGLAGLAVVLFAAGCPKPAAPVVDAGAAVSAADAGTPEDAGVAAPAPVELQLTITAVLLDGGTQDVAPTDGRAELDAARALELSVNVPLADYRVRLFDWNDQVVASDDTAIDPPDGGLEYRIGLSEPLHTGRRYALQLEAEDGPEITDRLGRTYDDVRIALEVRGEVVREPARRPGKKPARHRKRR